MRPLIRWADARHDCEPGHSGKRWGCVPERNHGLVDCRPVTSFNRELGLQAGDDGRVVLDTRPEHEVFPGTIHFAVLTTLGEVAAASAVGASVVPTTVQVQLLRRAQAGRLEARGRVLKAGRRLVFAEGEVVQEDRLVAKVTVTFALVG